jgi:hypothetical protein
VPNEDSAFGNLNGSIQQATDDRMKGTLSDAVVIGSASARFISYFPLEPGNPIYGNDRASVAVKLTTT